MKYILLMLFFLNSCKKNDNISKITHSDIGIKDSLHFKIQNKSNTNYVLYIEKRRLYYNASLPNQISMNFEDKDKPVVISQDFTAPFFMLDEEGNLSTEDSILQASYIDCIKKNRDWVLVVPAKKMIEFRMPLIDTIDYCGRLNYPVLNRGVEYKASINLRLDSNLISRNGMKRIEAIRKHSKAKLFQGQLNSNTIVLRY